MRTFKTEFPGYEVPPELLEFVNVGYLRDISWHNDASPSFALTPDDSAVLWIEHQNPAQREIGGARFVVALYDEDHNWLSDPLITDSLDELLKYLVDHWDIR